MAMAIALHMKMLFHCPKKSGVDAVGQKRPNGMTQAVATTTFSRLTRLAKKHDQIIHKRNIVPVVKPGNMFHNYQIDLIGLF